ncbi:unnamed protein product [Alopecurus aequalis]
MPALMAQRSSSAMRNEIRRELERRRKTIDVAKGRVVKKSSGALPHRLIPSAGSATLKLANAPAPKERVPPPRVLIPTGAPGAERNKITYLDLGDAPKRLTHRREAPLILRAPAAATEKLSARTEHEHETTEAGTKQYIKKPSSAPIEQPHSSSILVKKAINVAKGRVVKKSSATLPPRRLIPSAGTATVKRANAPAPKEGVPPPRVLIPTGAPGAERNKITYLDLGDAPKRLTQRREAPLIPRAPAAATEKLSTRTEHEHETTQAEIKQFIKKPSSSILVKKGMTVKMRMPAGTLPTGQRLVILHDAVVVSDVEDGFVEVICKGNAGRTVRIALDQVKTMPPTK